jgi:hypothetical protein
MDLQLRPGTPEDAEACGRICYEAFVSISERHAFPAEVPSLEVGVGLVSMLLNVEFRSVRVAHAA